MTVHWKPVSLHGVPLFIDMDDELGFHVLAPPEHITDGQLNDSAVGQRGYALVVGRRIIRNGETVGTLDDVKPRELP